MGPSAATNGGAMPGGWRGWPFEGGEEKVVMINAAELKAHRTASSLRAKKRA